MLYRLSQETCFVIRTNRTPPVLSPAGSRRWTRRYPSRSRSSRMHAHAAKESRPISSSLILNLETERVLAWCMGYEIPTATDAGKLNGAAAAGRLFKPRMHLQPEEAASKKLKTARARPCDSHMTRLTGSAAQGESRMGIVIYPCKQDDVQQAGVWRGGGTATQLNKRRKGMMMRMNQMY